MVQGQKPRVWTLGLPAARWVLQASCITTQPSHELHVFQATSSKPRALKYAVRGKMALPSLSNVGVQALRCCCPAHPTFRQLPQAECKSHLCHVFWCLVLPAGGGFGGPIRSRLVGDGSLPDEAPIVLAPQRATPPEALPRTSSWRPGAEGSTPPDRWNGTATLVSMSCTRPWDCGVVCMGAQPAAAIAGVQQLWPCCSRGAIALLSIPCPVGFCLLLFRTSSASLSALD